ncbi:IS701 family transposase, partial [Candidatus Marithioploca araucensis]|nr:IS701 family transposase [Candidatus Marithioploca araucensis]
MNKLLDIYTDYIISSFDQTTATNLSRLLEGEISHDQVTRFLSQSYFSSSYLWLSVKSVVRDIQNNDGVLIFDDTIVEKPYTNENDIINWHYD